MRCLACGDDDVRRVTPGCQADDGELLGFSVCWSCDYGINEHTEGVCECEREGE